MLARIKAILGQSAVYGLGNVLAQGIAFLLIPVYANYLSPDEYAILSIAATVNAALVVVLQFGLAGALTRFHFDYLDDQRARRSYYGTIWLSLTGASLLLALLLNWQGEWLFQVLFRSVSFVPYGRLAVWQAFVTVASVVPLVLFRVREQPIPYTLLTVGRFLLSTGLIVFFVIARNEGAAGALKGQVLAGAIMAVPFTYITLRNIRFSFHWDKLKASLAFGLPLVPHQLSSWALQMSDRPLMEHFLPLEQVGVYSLGYRIGQMLDLILSSANMAWAPFFMRTAATEEDAPRIFARLTTYLVAGILVLALGMALLGRDIILVMASPKYHEAYSVVPIVTLGFLAHGLYFLVTNQLFFVKRTLRLPLYTALSAGVNIGLNVLTLPRFGMLAAAWNTAIGYVLLFLLVFWDSKRVYPVPYEYRRLGTLLAVAGLVYLPGHFLTLTSPYLDALVKLGLVACFPAALFLFRFFTPREIAGLRVVLGRIRQRLVPGQDRAAGPPWEEL